MPAERDYIDRTIAMVRNHRDADNCWLQWANIFADEIERLRAELQAAQEREKSLRKAADDVADVQWSLLYDPNDQPGRPNPMLRLRMTLDALAVQRTEEPSERVKTKEIDDV